MCLNSFSQDSGLTANEAIVQLKSSVLIVRLDMKRNAQDSYKSVLENPKSSPKQKELVNERLTRLTDERKRYKDNVMKSVENTYRFSSYAFIDNHDIDIFQRGDNSVLISKDAMLQQKISEDKYFYLIKGDSDTHWIITDSRFKTIKSPFPSGHDLGIRKLFDFLVKKEEFDISNENRVFSKMQSRLDKYLLQASQ